MAVAPAEPAAASAAFRTVRGLADDLGLAVRSMGMTEDLEVAVAEGSTMVRVGRGPCSVTEPDDVPGGAGRSARLVTGMRGRWVSARAAGEALRCPQGDMRWPPHS